MKIIRDMRKKLHYIFLILSIFALLHVTVDYVCGHMGENPFNPTTCPLCAAFNSVELGCSLLVSFLVFDNQQIVAFISYEDYFPQFYPHLTVISNRAPPSSCKYL